MALPMVGGNERLMQPLLVVAGALGKLQQGALLRISCGAGECEKLVALKASASHW